MGDGEKAMACKLDMSENQRGKLENVREKYAQTFGWYLNKN